MRRRIDVDALRSVVFGVEDSLVSTTGVVLGVAAGSGDARFVALAGLVTVLVEAISMGVGQYLSEEAVHELDPHHRDSPALQGVLMFLSYVIAGFVPLAPALVLPYPASVPVILAASAFGLFGLGYVKAAFLGRPRWRGGFRILLLGGIATVAGIVVGVLFR